MQFTLTFKDYVDQYLHNMQQEQMHCPVCYEQVMINSQTTDMEHMVDCYKEQRLYLTIKEFYQSGVNHDTLTLDGLDRLVSLVSWECAQEIKRLVE